ncbi:MAG: hypothetical protein CVU43_12705 [Chloroflexi bacterium HGW-Chloroflexi-5]|jgi:peroxiredoxin|nr:MAG: hypothetical protein CVU43_12705 [Chloroflexi bacterium HGW-Chloroflexi-5]
MMQLHLDYQKIQAMGAEVLVVVPNRPKTIRDYRHNTGTPYPILSDKASRVAGQYLQIKQFFSLGTPRFSSWITAGKSVMPIMLPR